MSKLNIRGAVCALALSVSTMPTYAAVISMDWKVSGDELISYDDTTGLRWLDLTETDNMSYLSVTAQLGTGGMFEGFRVATAAEVVALWSNYNVDLSAGNDEVVPGIDLSIISAAIQLGDTLSETSDNPTGVVGNVLETAPYNAQINYMGAYVFNDVSYYEIIDAKYQHNTTAHVQIGTYLVSAVPVPAAAWLFGSGLLGLASVARRKSS